MPLSIAIYGHDFNRHLDQGLAPEQYTYRFLAEGDSWMERSSAFTASLPDYLAREVEASGSSVLIINLAMFGDTLRRIGECADGEFAQWLQEWHFDAVLLSAGGNDFIDAARDPAPGAGILRNMAGQPLPANGHDCVNRAAVARLVVDYLDPNFARLYDAVCAGRNPNAPIFLNNYDTPVARNAPAPPGTRAWLYEAYRKNGIEAALWPDLTAGIFNDVQATIAGWTQGRPTVYGVPTDGTLVAAEPDASGDSGDWINEIHPNRQGWKKLAPLWHRAIRDVI